MLSSFFLDACGREAATVAGALDTTAAPVVLGLSLPSPTIFAQYLVFAVLLGGIYGLVALGLTMI
ncbi:branched-chain amino acid ABC transporter permease, partial [Halorubrum sp. C191]